MVVITIDKAPAALRGELSKWFLEIKPTVFVGHVNARVRDLLWDKICNSLKIKGAVLLYSCNNEQGFAIKMTGDPQRTVVDFDGLQLIRINAEGH